MKKILAVILIIVLIVIAIFLYKYNTYKTEVARVQSLNQEYENFTKDDILGSSLITLINKSMDLNKKNNVQVDDNNYYIENDTNSIKVDIKFLEASELFPMENISKLTSERFMQNYAAANFKCTKKEYHEKTGAIKYLLFEEI